MTISLGDGSVTATKAPGPAGKRRRQTLAPPAVRPRRRPSPIDRNEATLAPDSTVRFASTDRTERHALRHAVPSRPGEFVRGCIEGRVLWYAEPAARYPPAGSTECVEWNLPRGSVTQIGHSRRRLTPPVRKATPLRETGLRRPPSRSRAQVGGSSPEPRGSTTVSAAEWSPSRRARTSGYRPPRRAAGQALIGPLY